MGAVGGIGMLSAGLLGGPGIGYKQDYYASQKLESVAPDTYGRYRAEDENSFLFFPAISGLDGKKVGDLDVKIKNAEEKTEAGSPLDESEKLAATDRADQGSIKEAAIFGGRMALKWTALVPVLMAVGYLLLLLYFRSKGGYQQEVLHGEQPVGEHYTGGVEGPMEG